MMGRRVPGKWTNRRVRVVDGTLLLSTPKVYQQESKTTRVKTSNIKKGREASSTPAPITLPSERTILSTVSAVTGTYTGGRSSTLPKISGTWCTTEK